MSKLEASVNEGGAGGLADVSFYDRPWPVEAQGGGCVPLELQRHTRLEAGRFKAIIHAAGAGVETDHGAAMDHGVMITLALPTGCPRSLRL